MGGCGESVRAGVAAQLQARVQGERRHTSLRDMEPATADKWSTPARSARDAHRPQCLDLSTSCPPCDTPSPVPSPEVLGPQRQAGFTDSE
jgi:hypothetical protein